MPFSNEMRAGSSGNQGFSYNGAATRSLRFNDGSASYLSRTPSSEGNRRTFTYSCWFKRSECSVDNQAFLSAGGGASDFTMLYIGGAQNDIRWYDYDGSTDYGKAYNGLIRDSSAWFNVVFAFDTTQATADNRTKVYMNGVQLTSVGTDYGWMGQNHDLRINDDKEHLIGRYTGNTKYMDGYIADAYLIDGQQLGPDSFGESKNGIWIPKAYSGSFGTNGFHLDFSQTGTSANSSGMGADTSGNDHHFTPNNLNAYDSNIPDSPENNFASGIGNEISEPVDYQSYYDGAWSEGNLRFGPSEANWSNGALNFAMTSGKWYAECQVVNRGPSGDYVRFGMRSRPARTYDEYFWTPDGVGQIDATNSPYSDRVGTISNGDILMIALDLENNALYFGKNGTWENSATASEIANGTVTNAFASGTTLIPNAGAAGDGHQYFFYCQCHGHGTNPDIIWNAGQDSSFVGTKTAQGNSDSNGIGDFYYTPPTGFLACCTSNMPEPTIGPKGDIDSADKVHNSVTYTGTGSSQAVTGVGFGPDFVWIKKYAGGSVRNPILTDSTRGVTKHLSFSLTDAEFTNTNGLTAFGTDGFTVGSYDSVNENTGSYIAWNWRANGGTTTVDESGTIDGTVQANTTAGFSIVKYTGNATAGATVGHGLGVAPDTIWIHRLSNTGDWIVFHHKNTSAPATDGLKWNTTGATFDSNTIFNDTAPTSSVFSLGNSVDVNENANLYIAYCFKEIEGYSKFGFFEGNASTDGTMIYTGFKPRMIIAKCIDNTSAWHQADTNLESSQGNPCGYINVNTSEHYQNYAHYDLLSNGFKIRDNGTESNRSATFVYFAWATEPFKYATAGTGVDY